MHRIDGAAAAPGGVFTEGDPNVGTPATVVTDDWLNAVQEEIAGVIEGSGSALSKPSNAQLLVAILALIAAAVPAGKLSAFARTAAPTGWLECDGAVVSRSVYPALFAAVGTAFGAGDGSTTFGLPDLRGEFVRGWDHGRGVDAGRAFGTAQSASLASHTHDLDSRILTEGVAGTGLGGSTPGESGAIAATGATGGAETRPRNVAMLWCVKI